MKSSSSMMLPGLTLLLLSALFSCGPAKIVPASTDTPIPIATLSVNEVSGMVLDSTGAALGGAAVRVRGTDLFTVTDSRGRFTITNLQQGKMVRLTAWLTGYYIGGSKDEIEPGTSDVEIVLQKHAENDNPAYEWVSAFADAGKETNCQNCHSETSKGLQVPIASFLPFDEWAQDAHALSTQNIRFLTMYLGQDVNGNQSPATRYAYNRDYGRVPLRADLTQPYYGPGYKLDFPGTMGNCAACHVPAAAINMAYETDPTQVTGVGAEGVACDFCHKVWDVRLDPTSGLPYPNMPGVLSFEFLRPPEGHQFFAGPFDDVGPGEDAYSPIQRQSQFCAPCHFGTFWDTQIYNSFGEWLDSPYSKPVTGKTCQDCHMPPGKADHFARLDKGAMERDPTTIFSHLMPGASSADLLRKAVTMNVSASRAGNRVTVTVTIVNDKTGHDVPTDSPLRQLILLVQAQGPDGSVLGQVDGPMIPEYGGVGDPSKGYYAGLPGKIYAKVLMELWTEITPTGAYWNPTRIVSDNRLSAFESDTSSYIFVTPESGNATVKIILLFRRAFKELIDQKGWNVPDIVMREQTIQIP